MRATAGRGECKAFGRLCGAKREIECVVVEKLGSQVHYKETITEVGYELGGETGSPGAGAGKSDGIRRVAARVVTASQSCEDGEVCGGARSGSEQEAEAGVEMERAEEQRPGLPWRDGRGGWCEV
jgi:hypothetical protein